MIHFKKDSEAFNIKEIQVPVKFVSNKFNSFVSLVCRDISGCDENKPATRMTVFVDLLCIFGKLRSPILTDAVGKYGSLIRRADVNCIPSFVTETTERLNRTVSFQCHQIMTKSLKPQIIRDIFKTIDCEIRCHFQNPELRYVRFTFTCKREERSQSRPFRTRQNFAGQIPNQLSCRCSIHATLRLKPSCSAEFHGNPSSAS